MKKVGILNFQYSTHNYGAVLQAAALEHICRQLGHEAAHLDFKAKSKKTTVKGRVGQILKMLGLRKKPKANQVNNEEAFERFRQRFINRTTCIKSAKEFRAIAKGSDPLFFYSNGLEKFIKQDDPNDLRLLYHMVLRFFDHNDDGST